MIVIIHHTSYLNDFILSLNNHNWHIFSSNGLFWWWVMKDLDLQLLQWVKTLKISFGLVEKYCFWCILEIFSSNGLFWWWVMKDLDLQLLQWVKIFKNNFGLVEKYWFWCILEIMDESLTPPMDDGNSWKQCEWKQNICATTKWWKVIASKKLKGELR